MSRKLFFILATLGMSAVTLTGCVEDGGYATYSARPGPLYREQVVIERHDYYVAPRARYHRRKAPPHVYYPARDRRSPRCFGTNCYVGATYREDPYYRLD